MKAFPSDKSTENPDIVNNIEEGMDLRDYFAAKAMQARLNAVFINEDQMNHALDVCDDEGTSLQEEVGKYAYQIADAMMEARK